MPNTHSTLTGLFADVADAIRAKTGGSAAIVADDFPDAIAAIPTGGGGGSVPANDVNFYDYDGAIVASYSAADFADLSAMPANPTHTGLTAQGWNWSLSDAKTYVASYGRLNIGQMYATSDGKTRLYIHLEEGRLAPYLGLAVNGTAAVDWGDGTTGTVTGSSTETVVSTQHSYAAAGDYVVTVAVTGSMALLGDGSVGSQVFWKNGGTANDNRVYQNAIRKLELGANTVVGDYAFYNCWSLSSATLPSGTVSVGESAFNSCYTLASVTLPSGMTDVGDGAFKQCFALSSAAIPGSVESIGKEAFYRCYTLSSATLPNGVTLIDENAFYQCYTLSFVTIPNSVTALASSAFGNCCALPSVTIPENVTNISTGTFSSNNGLGCIRFKPAVPPAVAAGNAFRNLPADCVIYVPANALSAYTGASNYPSALTYTYVGY